MLDDLRQLMKQSWLQRGRVYLVTAGALGLAMTAFGFDPVEQAAGGAALWLAFATGVLALVSRAIVPAPAAAIVKQPEAQSQVTVEKKVDRHTHDLESRNLHAARRA